MSTKITRKRAGPGRPPVDSERVDVRLPRAILQSVDEHVEQGDFEGPGIRSRQEALREILRDTLPSIDQPVRDYGSARKQAKPLTAEEDARINAYYASGQPGVGAQFARAVINHLRSHIRSEPDITVDDFKEFVLDVFDDYGQSLEEHIAK